MYYNEFLSLLGERIRALRKEKNIKQEKLAELVDKATEHISFIERGERAPSLELLLDLARVLDVSLPYLLDVTATEQYSTEPIPAPVPSASLPESVKEPVIPEEKRRSVFERMQTAFEKVQELQKLAKEYGIADIFQDNGGKVLQVLIMLGLKISPGREGNDALDDEGNEYELKTVNYALTTQISTHHHLNKEILDKYRKVKAWYFAIYEDIELWEIWKVPPSQLEALFRHWEIVIDQTGKELNNPKIPLWFIQTGGESIYRNPDKPAVPRAKKPRLIKEREAQYGQEAQLRLLEFE
jgi:transcriptional regulator with XRE-family HTH domain